MYISGIIFYIVVALIGIFFLSILPAFAFLLYKRLRIKGKTYKNIGLTIFLLTILSMVALAIKLITSPSGFGPEYKSVQINQNIGGILFCNSEFNADYHTYEYDVTYKYSSKNGDTIDMGFGRYDGREWKQDEQLIRLEKWLILKTGYSRGADRLVLKNTDTDSTLIYNFDNKFIENDSLWKEHKIKSLADYCCSEVLITAIQDKEIIVKYKFRTDPNLTKLYNEKSIHYLIDTDSGKIQMTKVNDL